MIIDNVLAENRSILSQAEAKAVLTAFRIPILQSIPADSAQGAILVAQEIGYPVAMKIDSPDITHKTDVGGVLLGLSDAREVRNVYQQLTHSVSALRPDAKIRGVVVGAARSRRYVRMVGTVLKENKRMLKFTKSLGFKAEVNAEDFQLMDVSLESIGHVPPAEYEKAYYYDELEGQAMAA